MPAASTLTSFVRPDQRGFFIAILTGILAVVTSLSRAQAIQEARVAASTMKVEIAGGSKEIRVSLRSVDTPAITGAAAKSGTENAEKPVPVSWTDFDRVPPANCAWMIVIDSSNPARQRTVAACAEEVRSFLKLVPKGDAVMIASLARDLAVVTPFESSSAQLEAALAAVKADGDASLTTLIFQNVKHGLADHLAKRTEARQCVVLLTDGKDETPGGPVAAKARRDELIAEARKLGIPVHTFGFAEKATEENYFADLKELSVQTDGLHVPATVATRQLPDLTWPTLVGVMHGGGTAVLDVSSLSEAAPVRLELTSASGRKASVVIPRETVARVLHGALPPAAAVKSANPPSESGAPMMPVWGWGAVGVGLLAVIAFASRRNKTGAVVDVNQKPAVVRPEPVAVPRASTPVAEHASVPPTYLELCDAKKTRHTVTAKGVKIGSGKHNDIVIKDDSVSENHCLIAMKNGEWTIADLESANGVRVNGTYYHQASLSPDDLIQLGEVQMRFLAES
jgi:hypothetical protein